MSKKPTIEELEQILASPLGTYEIAVNPDGSIRADLVGQKELTTLRQRCLELEAANARLESERQFAQERMDNQLNQKFALRSLLEPVIELLKGMDVRGGLGYDVHSQIRTQLAKLQSAIGRNEGGKEFAMSGVLALAKQQAARYRAALEAIANSEAVVSGVAVRLQDTAREALEAK